MNNIVITGLGAISPAGVGKEALLKAIHGKVSHIRRLTKFQGPSAESTAGEINEFRAEDYIRDKRFRRIADISQYAITAGVSAVNDGNINLEKYSPERTGLIMCITHGAIGYSSRFHKELLCDGPQAASPALFSESVLNAPAGNVSGYFGIKGPVHTLIGGSTSVIEAIRLVEHLFETDRIDCCFLGAAEELNEIAFNAYARFGFTFAPGEGAGMLIFERRENVSGKGRGYAVVKGSYSGFCHKNAREDFLQRVMERCLKKAGLSIGNITNVFINSQDGKNAVEKLFMSQKNKPHTENISHLMGEAFCATTIFHMIIASLLLCDNLNRAGNVMIGAVSIEGNTASLVMSEVSDLQGG